MSLYTFSILISLVIYYIFSCKFWYSSSRFSVLMSLVFSFFKSSFPPMFLTVLYVLSGHYVYMTLMSTVPMLHIPIIFYSYVFFNSIIIWLPIVMYVFVTRFKSYVSHMLPYGSPLGLILLLPLVEIFSQIIRPLTLTIRFGTNLSAGHVLIFMFSYFVVLSSRLVIPVGVILFGFIILEGRIAILQSLIFITLLGLYLEETL